MSARLFVELSPWTQPGELVRFPDGRRGVVDTAKRSEDGRLCKCTVIVQPATVRLEADLHAELIAHAQAEAPNECAGVIACTLAGELVEAHRMMNTAASPVRFELDPAEQWLTLEAIREAGLELGAVYHSHTISEPVPSHEDVMLAAYAVPYLIVGLEPPTVRAYTIHHGQVHELEVEVLER